MISGAPTRILEQYKEEFGIKDIFALEEEVVEKSFTGKVACNYGDNKFCKVNELIKQYKTAPYLALGVCIRGQASSSFYAHVEVERNSRNAVVDEGFIIS